MKGNYKYWKINNQGVYRVKHLLTLDHPDYLHASEARKNLLDSFAEFDKLSKSIAKLQLTHLTERTLQLSMNAASNQFLQDHMFSLARLPKLIPQLPKLPQHSATFSAGMSHSMSSSSQIRRRAISGSFESKAGGVEQPNTPSSVVGSPWKHIVAQRKDADEAARKKRVELQAFREQRSQLERLIADAELGGDEEVVETLRANVEELETEIERIRLELELQE